MATAPTWSTPDVRERRSAPAPLLGLRTVKPLLRHVSRLTELPQRDLTGPSRVADLAKARHIVMWLARRFTGRSLPEIARILGARHHTTVLHACRRVDRVIAEVGRPFDDTPEAWAWVLWSRQWPKGKA